MYKYRAPLIYIEPVTELEAVDTPPLYKNSLVLKQGILIGPL